MRKKLFDIKFYEQKHTVDLESLKLLLLLKKREEAFAIIKKKDMIFMHEEKCDN